MGMYARAVRILALPGSSFGSSADLQVDALHCNLHVVNQGACGRI
jgi:hypothetical protein